MGSQKGSQKGISFFTIFVLAFGLFMISMFSLEPANINKCSGSLDIIGQFELQKS